MILSTSHTCPQAIKTLKANAEFRFTGLIESEEDLIRILSSSL